MADSKREGPVCPICHSNNIEYLVDHWTCHDCNWQTNPCIFKPKPPIGVNPHENISVDYGDDD